jgi:hypothetical protein
MKKSFSNRKGRKGVKTIGTAGPATRAPVMGEPEKQEP